MTPVRADHSTSMLLRCSSQSCGKRELKSTTCFLTCTAFSDIIISLETDNPVDARTKER